MFCPHCGSKTTEAQGICQACGQEIRDLSAEMEAPIVGVGAAGNCLNCSAPLGPDELFCGQCGTRVSVEPKSDLPLAANPIGKGNTPPRRTRGRPGPIGASAQGAYWQDAPPAEYEAPTEAYRRPQVARSALRTSPIGSPFSRGPMSRPALTSRLVSDKQYVEPASRSHAPLIIGLLCFLASFISGSAAIWLAVTALH